MSYKIIPPRQFTEHEIASARLYLASDSPTDWTTRSKLAPMTEQESMNLGARIVQSLSRGGFVDNLSHGATLLLRILSQLHQERAAAAGDKSAGG